MGERPAMASPGVGVVGGELVAGPLAGAILTRVRNRRVYK